MTDISKCYNQRCPKRATCYRFTAPDDGWQSYMNFQRENGECEGYWETDKLKENQQ